MLSSKSLKDPMHVLEDVIYNKKLITNADKQLKSINRRIDTCNITSGFSSNPILTPNGCFNYSTI